MDLTNIDPSLLNTTALANLQNVTGIDLSTLNSTAEIMNLLNSTGIDPSALLNSTAVALAGLLNSTTIPDFMDPNSAEMICIGPEERRTLALCGLESSFWGYVPSRSANLAFAVLFAISTIAFLSQGFIRKSWWGFTLSMVAGCALEVVGYLGRTKASDHLWNEDYFLIQIVCLTVAPAFLAAGIYLCLSRIVTAFGAENSRIKPRSYPLIFIVCDLISLVLQATGGGMASSATHNNEKPDTGNHIMLAGLAFQVFTLCLFIELALDFALRTYQRTSKFGASSTLDPRHADVRASWAFKGFLLALAISTLCIFTRCVYRVAELSEGWDGHLMKKQNYFIGLEGAVIIAAVLLLNIFHPGLCMKNAGQTDAVGGGSRTWYGKKTSSLGSSHSSHIELRSRSSI